MELYVKDIEKNMEQRRRLACSREKRAHAQSGIL